MQFEVDGKPEDDDEIIELTEIIEKGNAAAPASSAGQSSAQEDIFSAAVSDLGNTQKPDLPSDLDVDLDALLAQMDSDGGFSHLEELEKTKAEEAAAAEQAAAENASVSQELDLDAMMAEAGIDPHADATAGAESGMDTDMDADMGLGGGEQDLPDMSDIDALIAEMDMPEQPSDELTGAPAEESLSSPASEEFLDTASPAEESVDSAAAMDALLESLMDDAPTSTTAAPAPAATEEDILDMLDLADPAPAAPQPAAPEDASADLDALFDSVLQEAEGAHAEPVTDSVTEPEVAAPDLTKVPVDVSDMHFGEDAAPSSVSAPPAAPLSDLDALFQDVLGEPPLSAVDVAKAVVDGPTPSKKPVSEEPDTELLDVLFGESESPQDANISEDFMTDPVAQEASAVADEALAHMQEQHDGAEFDDAMLSVMQEMSQSAPVSDTAPSSDIFADMVEEATADVVQEPAPFMPEMAASAVAAAMASSVAHASAPAMPAVLDEQSAQRLQSLEERLTQLEEHVAETLGDAEARNSAAVQSAATHMSTLEEQLTAQAERMSAMEERLQDSAARAVAEAAEAVTKAAGEAVAKAVAEATEAAEAFAAAEKVVAAEDVSALESSTNAVDTADTANTAAELEQAKQEVNTLREQLAAQAERLAQVEERSQGIARDMMARDVAARDALSSYIDKLEFVAKEAVTRESAAHEALQQTIQRLEHSVQAQEDLSIASAKRITDLEERLHFFETTMEKSIERMATAAAATILREEIAALLSEE